MYVCVCVCVRVTIIIISNKCNVTIACCSLFYTLILCGKIFRVTLYKHL